jgi:hypothetical protein
MGAQLVSDQFENVSFVVDILSLLKLVEQLGNTLMIIFQQFQCIHEWPPE